MDNCCCNAAPLVNLGVIHLRRCVRAVGPSNRNGVLCHVAGPSTEIPYAVALVNLAEGVRMVMRVSECPAEAVTIGMEGEIQFRKVAEEIWVPVFVPSGDS
jgi:hypothetical protein